MEKIILQMLRWGEWTAQPLCEESWRRSRTRMVKWVLLIAAALALQTALVHSPDYMINGLYHNRRVNNLQLHAAPEAARSKLLERLCLTGSLLDQGGGDPYQIPGAAECIRKYREKLD